MKFQAIATYAVTALLLFTAPCFAEVGGTATAKYITIPIYYVTDREQAGTTYGPRRRYPSHCQHQMYYGTAFVNVPNAKGYACDDATSKSLGWKCSSEQPPKIASKDLIDSSDNELAKKQFSQRLKETLDASGKDELCVFVHGAADAFEDCLLDSADLAYYLKKPMVLYSWPSDPKRRGYFIDGSNSEWSQGHFNMFCKDLEAFKKEHPLQVIMLSHSMGNRLVIRSLPVIYGTGLVKDFELVSPDIDADTCRHYVMDYRDKARGKIRLYVSNKDKMLPLSQMLAGGYYRLGEAANPVEQAPSVKAELLERIDFTAVDTGITGHSIPSELVANMVLYDKPGDGLELAPESSVQASRFAKLAGRSQDFDPKSIQSDLCKKVIKVK